jgi:hypothetical protein
MYSLDAFLPCCGLGIEQLSRSLLCVCACVRRTILLNPYTHTFVCVSVSVYVCVCVSVLCISHQAAQVKAEYANGMREDSIDL